MAHIFRSIVTLPLPGFDEYLLGYRDRSAILDPQHAQKVVPGNNSIFMLTILIGGHLAGTWKRTFSKGKVFITASPFPTFSPAENEAFGIVAQRFGAYLGIPVVLP